MQVSFVITQTPDTELSRSIVPIALDSSNSTVTSSSIFSMSITGDEQSSESVSLLIDEDGLTVDTGEF